MNMNWEPLLSARRQGQKNVQAANSRTAFEQDFDRIIFSHPFRKLQDKTQVHPLPEQDFVHTRLTHSLEVSSVGRSLGRRAGEVIVQRHPELQPDFSQFDFGAITAAAALAHDLGNPPFGHAGEDALSDFFAQSDEGKRFREKVTDVEWIDLTKFEGNAQGYRILNSNTYGLNLTFATLGAFTKYPCSSALQVRDKNRKSQKKFGFYQSEKTSFQEIASSLELRSISEDTWVRHPLAFLVEAADDICYSIIDLEDGCSLGLVSFNDTVELLAAILKEDFKREKLNQLSGQSQKIGVLRALAIGKLVEQCCEVFLDHEDKLLDGTFDRALTDLCVARETLDQISSISVEKIYRARHVLEIEASGHEVLPGLLSEFTKAGEFLYLAKRDSGMRIPRKYQNISWLLSVDVRNEITHASSMYETLRIILDHISGFTDAHALSLFRKIKGMAL